MKFADIVIDISLEKLDKTFQYLIPENLLDKVHPGSQVIIPFGKGGRQIKGFVVDISEEPKLDVDKIKPISGIAKDSIAIESQLIELAAWMKRNYGSTMNQALKTVIPIKKKQSIKEKKTVVLKLSKEMAQVEFNALVSRARHSIPKEKLLEALMDAGQLSWDYIVGDMGISSSIIRDFADRGWIEIVSERAYRNPIRVSHTNEEDVVLNADQARACDAVINDWNLGDTNNTYLLYGVTGSGKTEVYMKLLEETLKRGKSAIVLIPEIALTYQTVNRFYNRFGSQVSIINSRMTPAERFDQFERAKTGDISVMVGPRSALFTPFTNLGIIIIDEEHEGSYKSEVAPRYHARETAIARAAMNDATVVLGSATPSVESFTRAQAGEYKLLKLENRVMDRPMPQCDIVDLRDELMSGNRSILSRKLQVAIEDRLNKKEQVMLFLNRRGLMGFISCRACGHVIKCPHCDVSLSLHGGNKLKCHYCGYETANPKVCPECGSKYIGGFKAGTQKVEEIVKAQYPSARVVRMDMDTTRGKHGHEDILKSFANHEADILIGTQMIVKGHDFPEVTLVGILAADMSLNASDFHCAERTFQLITQAAGRAGRGDKVGNVVIQTYQPDNYSVVAAANQDYENFYKQEIAYRRLMDYPPAAHMLLILVTSENESHALGQANAIVALLNNTFDRIRCMGPSDAGIAKLNDVYRKVIYIKERDYEKLISYKDKVEKYLLDSREYADTATWFDFDPMSGF
ncbi:MAG: primosomal protein N' [Lachnospiraceae bacterium]|nr:primosomal protein N' [Lachnospiraceae bacterium]